LGGQLFVPFINEIDRQPRRASPTFRAVFLLD
jgi:hypothetical protein